MIVHVWRRAIAANLGQVLVAASDLEIVTAIEAVGGTAILTDPDLPSGSDRVYAAVQQFDPSQSFQTIINLQGDMPTLQPQLLHELADAMNADNQCDIATLGVVIETLDTVQNPNVVKIVLADPDCQSSSRAVYFSRAAVPHGARRYIHHLGLYGFRRSALARFVALPEASLERYEKLEQLRALAAGMTITVQLVNAEPFGVDSPADLEIARKLLQK